MKNQLLEDFGDSASRPVAAPALQPALRPLQRAEPDPEPTRLAAAPKVWRARAAAPRTQSVWRARAGAAAPPLAAPLPPAPQPPAPQPPAPDLSAFSSEQPDPIMRLPVAAPSWSERWGRRALGWSAGIALCAAALGAGAWLYQDSRVVSNLALVADASPPPRARAPWVPPESDAPPAPPLVLMPTPAPAAPAVPSVPVADNGEAAARAAAADAVRRAEARREAARKEAARKETLRKQAAKKEAVKKDAARMEAAGKEAAGKEAARNQAARKDAARREAARLAAAREADPAAQQEETLRQCRAAGYHASACIRRGCVATRFGLACRG